MNHRKYPHLEWDIASSQIVAAAEFPLCTLPASLPQAPPRPFDERHAANSRQSESLCAVRDALLPKLISGELRVPEAERIVGRAV